MAIPALRVTQVKAAWSARWHIDAVDLGSNHWSVKVPDSPGKARLSMMVTGKPDAPDED